MGARSGATELPGGTVAFLFSDIEGSTLLWDHHPDEMAAALARHDEILHRSVDSNGGVVFSTSGDGLAAAFPTAAAAVTAAVDAQRGLGGERWPEPIDLRVRMGVHTGEAERRDGDYFGPVVNRAARLMGVAHGGQLVISSVTAELVAPTVPVELIDLGTVWLRGFDRPEHTFGVAAEGLEWVDRPLSARSRPKGNLPRPASAFVGDVAELADQVAPPAEHRLVTFTGSGGVGKTRAAVEVGRRARGQFVDGIWMIELAAVTEPEAVAAAIATGLEVQATDGATIEDAIVDWCRGRRLLLIVDNCEHLLDEVCAVVRTIIARCPALVVLATSREPLGIDGEQVIRIGSLDAEESLRLFLDRARAADNDFEPTPDDIDVIGAICRRLDGIPLAIELAAARIRSLTPVELLERLHDRFRVLRGGGRGAIERHQTLKATVTWSYQLLTPPAQRLFTRLSVFAGGFDLDAAEAVGTGDGIDGDDALDLIAELVDKSMVVAERSAHGTRYRLLETLRQYGEERLDDDGDATTVRDAHLAHYTDLVRRLHHLRLSPAQLEADAAFDREWDNFRAALGWALAVGDLDRAEAIVVYSTWYAQARLRHDHHDWVRRTLAVGDDDRPSRSRVLAVGSWWANTNDNVAEAVELARRGLESAKDDDGRGHCVTNLYHWLATSGRTDDARALAPTIEEASRHAPGVDVRWAATQALLMGRLRTSDALELLDRYVDCCREIGAPAYLASAHLFRGMVKCFSATEPDLAGAIAEFEAAMDIDDGSTFGDALAASMRATAMVLAREAVAGSELAAVIMASHEARYWPTVRLILDVSALHLALSGDHVGAATLIGHVEQRSGLGGELGRRLRDATGAMVAAVPDLEQHRTRGAGLGPHEAVEYTLSRLGPASNP